MRSAALTLILLAGSAYAGDGILGTKASPTTGGVTPDSSGVGFMPFMQMILALGVVLLLLKFVMPKLVTKLNKKIVSKDGSSLQIEESAAFAGGSLYIVRAKGKTLLLSASNTGVSCLADLTGSAAPELPSFQEIVEKEQSGPLQPFAVVQAEIPEYAAKPTTAKAKRVLDVDEIGSKLRKNEPAAVPDPAENAPVNADALAVLERLSRLTG